MRLAIALILFLPLHAGSLQRSQSSPDIGEMYKLAVKRAWAEKVQENSWEEKKVVTNKATNLSPIQELERKMNIIDDEDERDYKNNVDSCIVS